jgi:hypothetical protein
MRHRALPKVDWQFTLAMAAVDLICLTRLLAQRMPYPRTHPSRIAIPPNC